MYINSNNNHVSIKMHHDEYELCVVIELGMMHDHG